VPATPLTTSSGLLPITGFDLEGIAEVAAGLMLAGGGALAASRRWGKGRRRH
jgi:LPXTG-motif cell wall-anchored protein